MIWIFDKPVSNSGRIKKMLLDFAHEQQLNWEVDLQFNPDKYLVENADYLVSSDAWILEHCKRWFNLIPFIAETEGLNVNLLSFEGAEEIAPPHL